MSPARTSEGLVDVAARDDVAPGTTLRVEVGDVPICLVGAESGELYAVHDVCTHAEASLSEGWVDRDRIECPRHGAAFSAASGEVLTPPATMPLPTFSVEVHAGRILVDPTPSRPHPLRD